MIKEFTVHDHCFSADQLQGGLPHKAGQPQKGVCILFVSWLWRTFGAYSMLLKWVVTVAQQCVSIA